MKIEVDRKTGNFTIVLNDSEIAHSQQVASNCIVDFDEKGRVIGIEIIDAREHGIDVTQIEQLDVAELLTAKQAGRDEAKTQR